MDAVKRHSQSTWPVSMRPLHAETKEEMMTGRKKVRSCTNTRKKQTTDGKSTATALALVGNSTPAITDTNHRSAVSPRVRRFGSPHKRKAHTASSHHTNGQKREATHRHRLHFSPTANGTRPQPAANRQRTRSEQSPKEPHAEADPHQPMTRRLAPCGHTECTVSSIDLILRPSLEDASVSDGP
ncbi:hypothetical protein TcCL_Unassigned02074 [Trypanosoma cruzi]|nr:hypothetical protein TcCL_Unassigned02074 [Trypanosoma cruzi]